MAGGAAGTSSDELELVPARSGPHPKSNTSRFFSLDIGLGHFIALDSNVYVNRLDTGPRQRFGGRSTFLTLEYLVCVGIKSQFDAISSRSVVPAQQIDARMALFRSGTLPCFICDFDFLKKLSTLTMKPG